jgi:hypothetical protein
MAITTNHVGVRLEKALVARVKDDAKSERRTLSNLINKIVAEYYEAKDAKSKPGVNGKNGHHHKIAPTA